MVPVTVVGLQLNPTGSSVVVLAESAEASRMLPIMIGPAEAQAIAIAVSGLGTQRPGTHDLMLAIIDELDARLEEVAVTELVEGTFHAELFLETPSGLQSVSARPSDALALAVRAGVPISVHSVVMAKAAVETPHETGVPLSQDEIDEVVEDFHGLLNSATADDFADPGNGTS